MKHLDGNTIFPRQEIFSDTGILLFCRLFTERELLTDLTAIVTLSRECETLLRAVDDHFRNVCKAKNAKIEKFEEE